MLAPERQSIRPRGRRVADWPYSTARWQRLRRSKLQSEPLCEMCKADGTLAVASVVDHVRPVKHGGDPFPALDGLTALCASCHGAKTARGIEAGAAKTTRDRVRKGCDASGRPLAASHPWNGGNGYLTAEAIERRMPSNLMPSRIPLTIVCGPPGAGKSTYVRQHANPDDYVICVDTILQRISGAPEHHAPVRMLPKALDIRNDMLRSLARSPKHDRAWFIVSAPSPRERYRWHTRLGGSLVVLHPPLAECIRRIKADPARAGEEERMIEVATKWWQANHHLVGKYGKSLIAEALGTAPNLSAQLVSGSGRADG